MDERDAQYVEIRRRERVSRLAEMVFIASAANPETPLTGPKMASHESRANNSVRAAEVLVELLEKLGYKG